MTPVDSDFLITALCEMPGVQMSELYSSLTLVFFFSFDTYSIARNECHADKTPP